MAVAVAELPYHVVQLIVDMADVSLDTRRHFKLKPRKLNPLDVELKQKLDRMFFRRKAFSIRGNSTDIALDSFNVCIDKTRLVEVYLWLVAEDAITFSLTISEFNESEMDLLPLRGEYRDFHTGEHMKCIFDDYWDSE